MTNKTARDITEYKQKLEITSRYIKSKLELILNREVFYSVELSKNEELEKVLFKIDGMYFDATDYYHELSDDKVTLRKLTYDVMWCLYLKSVGDSLYKNYTV